MTVRNQLDADKAAAYVYVQIRRRYRRFFRFRKDGKLAVLLENGSLNIVKVKKSLHTAKKHEFGEIKLRFFQIFAINFSIVKKD